MNILNLYLEYGSSDRFPAKSRIAAEEFKKQGTNINSLWKKYFNTKDSNEKISIFGNIIVLEYERRNKKVRIPIDFREFGRAYIKRAQLEEQDVLEILSYKFGS